MPVFVLAYILILVFSIIELDWLPVQGYRNIHENFWDWLRHLILPSIALGTVYRADRAHHAREHRRAGAGLHTHRAGKGLAPEVLIGHALKMRRCRS